MTYPAIDRRAKGFGSLRVRTSQASRSCSPETRRYRPHRVRTPVQTVLTDIPVIYPFGHAIVRPHEVRGDRAQRTEPRALLRTAAANVQRLFRDLGRSSSASAEASLLVLSPAPADELAERARDVLGVNFLHPALCWRRRPRRRVRPPSTCCVNGRTARSRSARASRQGLAFTSHELAIVVGKAVQDELGLGVDLTHPDIEVHLEEDERELFAFSERIPGRGGLPGGDSGGAVRLVSGGIDFRSPLSGDEARATLRVRPLLWQAVHRPRVDPQSVRAGGATGPLPGASPPLVPFGTSSAIGDRRRCAPPSDRPAAADGADGDGARRAGGRRGARHGRFAGADVVADAPQPHVVEDAATLPVLRRLVAWDKSEIVREAQDIGTYEIANLPAEDCCTLFASPLAETRAAPDQLVKIERRLDLDETVAALLEAAEIVRPRRDSPSLQPTLRTDYAGNIAR